MQRIDFQYPLTVFEIRDPALVVCREIADERGLYVTFHQPQQPALSGNPGQRNRCRIGNGKHKDWYIHYQEDEPQISNPRLVGKIALKAPFYPDDMQYGGFDYGKFGEESPTYNHITLHTPSELGHYRPVDPDPDLLDATYSRLADRFNGDPRLFDITEYTV